VFSAVVLPYSFSSTFTATKSSALHVADQQHEQSDEHHPNTPGSTQAAIPRTDETTSCILRAYGYTTQLDILPRSHHRCRRNYISASLLFPTTLSGMLHTLNIASSIKLTERSPAKPPLEAELIKPQHDEQEAEESGSRIALQRSNRSPPA